MSDLGPVDSNCVVRVIGRHCPGRDQCVLLYRAPGPRLLFGSELMSELDDEKGIYLETHAKQLAPDLISITVDHVGRGRTRGRLALSAVAYAVEDGGWLREYGDSARGLAGLGSRPGADAAKLDLLRGSLAHPHDKCESRGVCGDGR